VSLDPLLRRSAITTDERRTSVLTSQTLQAEPDVDTAHPERTQLPWSVSASLTVALKVLSEAVQLLRVGLASRIGWASDRWESCALRGAGRWWEDHPPEEVADV
jgi:hypothetical protein